MQCNDFVCVCFLCLQADRSSSGQQRTKMAQFTLAYEFTTALRGFHVYRSEWTPQLDQSIKFKQELKNPYDKFAVAGQTNIPGKLCLVTVGQVPKEMSRHIWYAIKEGAGFSATVKSVSPKRSPLKQGGLEIIITMKAKWQNSRAIDDDKDRQYIKITNGAHLKI